MQIQIAQSTPTAASIASVVELHYDMGRVVDSEFLRRSFNQVYRLGFTDGRRVVARLCAERPRGAPNVVFEAAVLDHWATLGCPVSRCLPAANGEVAIEVHLPEGPRALMLFEYLEGEATGDAPEDIGAFARGLAALHTAGESYAGPASAYRLDLNHLLMRPLESLLRASTMTSELRPQFEALGRRLHDDILAMGTLGEVMCHGDAHGENNFVVDTAQGGRRAVFFDFDESGPGHLAYELAVYPWKLHPRTTDGVWSDKAKAQWRCFIAVYREARRITDDDLAAIPRFMAVRQFWLLGEYAGRTPMWGSQAMPTDYLRRQAAMLRKWEALEMPR
jgi:Ser/Thr protein kinase RdoA (MazF antagonist)